MKTLKTILQEVISGIKAWVDTNTVHKSGNETINGDKTWTGGNVFSAETYNNHTLLTNTTLDLSNGNPALSETNQGMILFTDKNKGRGKSYARLQSWTASDQTVTVLAATYRPDANTENDFSVWLSNKQNLKSFHPYGVYEAHLGNSTYRWKTLNGVNPGALSLPDYANDVSIDTTSWNKTGSMIVYTPLISGWLQLTIPGDVGNFLAILDSGSSPLSGQEFDGNGSARLYLTYPVIANRTYWIYIKASSIITARIVPCLGNV